MDYNKFLWDCKKAADMGISKIPKDSPVITQIWGMSSPDLRHCLNNVNRYGRNYLEIGCHRGSTFVSSLYGHEDKKGWAIDNYAEFCTPEYSPGQDGTHKDELLKNINIYLRCQTQFFLEDSFKFDLNKITEPVDVYMYDGDHDEDKQQKALDYYYPVLNDVFLFIVDDWNSQSVRDGTFAGISGNGLSILAELPIRTSNWNQPNYWNGLYLTFLAKECPKDRFLQKSFSTGGCCYAHPIKRSAPRDVVYHLKQPVNNKTEKEIKKILKESFPNLSPGSIEILSKSCATPGHPAPELDGLS